MTVSPVVFYATAIRNTVGRKLGSTLAYSASQKAVAAAMNSVFSARGCDADTSGTCVGCFDGECSLILNLRGDQDEAGGAGQWHNPRRLLILKNTGIDVWTNFDPAAQAKAFVAEISQSWSSYKHVEAALLAAVGIPAKMQVLLAQFEQSGNQARDLARRVPMATYWAAQFGSGA